MSMIKLSYRDQATMGLPSMNIRINQRILMCEYAASQDDRETGLMYRNMLPWNRGMIFRTYGRYRPQFHMANVRINLEGIFVGNDMKIVDIIPMLKLDVSSLYTTYKNIPISWVVEVNMGYSSRNNVNVGDRVYIGNY